MNGASKGTSGVVDLGTVLTSFTETTLTTATTGTGNAVTGLNVSGHQITMVKNSTFLTAYTESDPIFTGSAAYNITSQDITNWNNKTDNVGTITGINMNGASKGTSGVVDLGTVLTEHQSLSGYMYSVSYNSTDKKIYFYDKESHQIPTYVDATDFIKDGMVNDVKIATPSAGTNSGVSCLVVTFNTDAGKEDIEITLASIFDASNYYDKDDINNMGYITTETQLSTATTGTGNAITNLTVSGHQITMVKNSTFLTSYTETDPIFTGSPAYNITSQDITNWNNKISSYTETDPVFTTSAAHSITSEDISNWNSKTDNTGTITGINMNGESKGTSGVVDLGTVLTSFTETTLSTATTGTGNAVTNLTVSNHKITMEKGSTFTTSGDVETQITGKHYVTSSDTKTQIEGYNYTTSAATKTQIENYHYVTSSDTKTQIENYHYTTSSATKTQIENYHYVTSSDTKTQIEGYGYTTNAGTITGINMNGASKGTSGVVDLGTVLTSFTETQLSTATTGTGNVITGLTVSNHQITTQKGQVNGLPSVTSSDNGKILIVSGGTWTMTTPVNIYSGSGVPNNSLGNNGDIYLQTS